MAKTLFVRLAANGFAPVMLRTQYRLHPVLSAIPNALFYEGQLLDGVTAEQRLPCIEGLAPLIFVEIGRGREQACSGGSFINIEEGTWLYRGFMS